MNYISTRIRLLIPYSIRRSYIITNWLKMAKSISLRYRRDYRGCYSINKLYIIKMVKNIAQNSINTGYIFFKNPKLSL